jgi:enoyl-CoA hydratase/carnithine racemase
MTVRTQCSDGVLRLTLDRVDKKNALDQAMYRALAAALGAAAEDPAVRVAILDGAGDVFCAGNDLADFQSGQLRGLDGPIGDFLWAISTFPKPLIGAVHGVAVGIGTTMLLHCDLVYAAEGTRFALPFVNLALVPEAASTLLLPRLMGHQRAAELLFFGEHFDAAHAHAVGIVNAVVPRGDLTATVDARARVLVAKPLRSLITTKKLLKHTDWDAVHAAMKSEAAFFVEGLSAPEAKEAFAAFFERRTPDFRRFT